MNDIKPEDMNIYVVIARRWGDVNKHSYVVGVFDDISLACDCVLKEEAERGGAYTCYVEPLILNKYEIDGEG